LSVCHEWQAGHERKDDEMKITVSMTPPGTAHKVLATAFIGRTVLDLFVFRRPGVMMTAYDRKTGRPKRFPAPLLFARSFHKGKVWTSVFSM